jgi:hypothetical protein
VACFNICSDGKSHLQMHTSRPMASTASEQGVQTFHCRHVFAAHRSCLSPVDGNRQSPAQLSRTYLSSSGNNMYLIIDAVAFGAKLTCKCLPRPIAPPPESPRGQRQRSSSNLALAIDLTNREISYLSSATYTVTTLYLKQHLHTRRERCEFEP